MSDLNYEVVDDIVKGFPSIIMCPSKLVNSQVGICDSVVSPDWFVGITLHVVVACY